MNAQLVDLLLHQQHRLFLLLCLQQGSNSGDEKPAEEDQNQDCNEYQCKEICEFHDGPWEDLQQSQCVLENFAKLADLGCAHGSFVTRSAEIIIDAFLQVPLQQLHALFHAHLFGTATARLMQLVELDNLTHDNG